ncbi:MULTISPECIES: CDF family Co(II)/Ni(II) efflux transporter DmeF [unclassified Leptolyngbya]|uniref:CDF family Co(II)/Ni(II) efflux transporter DmeF n=1 Tax=unclassified Leptolyngbya TaxID=2650499 RepID=UPI001689C68C|nr:MULTISPECIES: CDF family Co(II)/Ni(II) efflux transporter DmeF [unclassified Leptolyngbya]MBD1909971.1 CDF family Co(II)/Ni(II) efflux transporter DmeF [Leptolyngbya sp. FACHB-8]MBD2156044.1 CDF family Co(II)/Ni(II) efflux transporter DmeF [Leptolyngbya sp. FACHB-16]
MHNHSHEQWQHSHDFLIDRQQAERNTKIVLLLTAITMVAEVIAGSIFGSMALLADGWHMATHVAAFGITVFAYQYARRHANNPAFTFGTGKVGVLGGFTSAIALGVVVFLMAIESAGRLFHPERIQFTEAIYVAIIGLIVNLASALLLQDHHGHDHYPGHHAHEHDDHHDHDHHDHSYHAHNHPKDHNLQAAYVHVLADALTSVLAIVALCAGKFLGWVWLDAVMGFVGAAVIGRWAYGLVRETSVILLDGGIDKQTRLAIVTAIEDEADNQVVDLHVWNLSPHHLAATISLVTHTPHPPEHYKSRLKHIPSLAHVLIEVNACQAESCRDMYVPQNF